MGKKPTKDVSERKSAGRDLPRMTQRAAWPIDEGAYRLGVGRTSIYKLATEGKIRLIKIAGRRLIPDEEIVRLTNGEIE